MLAGRVRKVLVVVSDGGDNASHITFDQLLERAQSANVVIYGVALVDPGSPDRAPRIVLDACGSGPPILKPGPATTFNWTFWPGTTEPILILLNRSAGSDVRIGAIKLATVGTPQISDSRVTRADEPRVLEYDWGGQALRWELEPRGAGTRLTLWHRIDRRYISMGAAGWHICFDVLERFLAGEAIGRIVAGDALKFSGWQRLHAEYAKQFGVEPPAWPPKP